MFVDWEAGNKPPRLTFASIPEDDLMASIPRIVAMIRETDRQIETGEFYQDPLCYLVGRGGQKIPLQPPRGWYPK